jgi:PAS domain S-box-containing protein
MRRTLAIAVSLLLFAWGGYSFQSRVSGVAAEIGVEWIDTDAGVVADSVIPREPGWRGGLRPGDRLLAVDGSPVSGSWEAEGAVRAAGPDAALVFRVERGGETFDLRVDPFRVGGGSPVYYYLSIVGLIFLGVGLLVWLRATRARAAVPFALHCQAMFLYLVHSPTGRGGLLDLSAFWGDLLGVLLAPALFLHVNWALTDEDRGAGSHRRLRRALIYLPPLLLLLFNLYLVPLRGIYDFADPVGAWRVKGRLEELYIAVYLIVGISKAVRSYLDAERLQTRWQLRWMAWGSVVGFLPATLFYLVPLSLDIHLGAWSELSVLTMALVPLAFAAAVVHYRLLDLDIFLKRGTVAIGMLLAAGATYAACYALMDRAAGGSKVRGLNLALILATFLMAIFYPRVHRHLKAAVEQFFYRERYDYRRTLTEFGEALNRELSLPTLVRKFTGRVERTFGLQAVRVFVRDAAGPDLRGEDGLAALRVDDPIVQRLAGIDYLSLADHPGLREFEGGPSRVDLHRFEYLLPLTVEGEIVAVLGVGEAHGGQPLTSEDLNLLVSFCRHGAVAFAGARLYSAIAEKVKEVEALREFNESILESSRVGILVVDPGGRILGVNRAFEALYGAGREALLGGPLEKVLPAGCFSGPESDAGGSANHPPEAGRAWRSSLRTPDGRSLLVNLTSSALRGPDGSARGLVVTIDDVTEQVRREEEVQRREHLASIGLLASGIAHEVNTPLTGISSYAQLLLERRDPGDPEYETLRTIEQQAFRASGIASSLLNFSRQRDGDHQTIDLDGLVAETLQLFEPHLRGRPIRLRRLVDGPLPGVSGNRGRIQQVLMNLLLNAVDAMPQGGDLTLAAGARGGRVTLEISDTGVGIPREHLDRICDPFFTTKSRGKGTGLGLSITYGIIKEHAGTLTVDSRPGHGSRFTVSLPAVAAERKRVPV